MPVLCGFEGLNFEFSKGHEKRTALKAALFLKNSFVFLYNFK